VTGHEQQRTSKRLADTFRAVAFPDRRALVVGYYRGLERMARHKDIEWNCGDSPVTKDLVQIAVLMDIRDELKALNNKLDCFRVRRMLNTVQRIDKRLSKRINLK
jgi:hypothetical protein